MAAWIGCGCCLFLVIVAIAIAVAGTLAIRAATGFAHELAADVADPEVRRERALQILRPRDLPDGYQPIAGFRIPLLLEVAALADRSADDRDGKEPLFVYFNAASFLRPRTEDWREGWLDVATMGSGSGLGVDLGEELDRGELTLEGATAEYLVHRGSVELGEERRRGVLTLIKIDCQADRRFRGALWTAAGDWDDTAAAHPARERATAAFLGSFDLCPTPARPRDVERSP